MVSRPIQARREKGPRWWAISLLALLLVIVGVVLSVRTWNNPEVDGPEVTRDQLELRDGLLYRKSTDQIFNGTLVSRYDADQLQTAMEIRKGKLHGPSRGYYENGQQEVDETFVKGVSHGKRTRWYANGQIKSLAEIIDGRIEGTFIKWHPNGQKSAQVEMVGGKPDGLSEAWYESGARKARVVMKEGEIVRKEYFDDPGS